MSYRKLITTITLVLSAFLVALQPTLALADTDFGKEAARYGTPYFDPSTQGAVCQGGGGASETGANGEHPKALLEFLTGKGLSLAAAAGVAGNIQAESGFNPAIIQGGRIATANYKMVGGVGFGLAQWTSGGRQQGLADYAKAHNKPIIDFTVQLGWLWQEMNSPGYKKVVTVLNGNKADPVQATIDFHNIFERSADSAATVKNGRGALAQALYNKYKGVIKDGSGVAGVAQDGEAVDITQVCNADNDLSPGSGNFKDNGEVAGFKNVLHNAQLSEKAYGSSLVGNGKCAYIVSRVWRGAFIGYGYPLAIDMWNSNPGIRHPDRNPKKGAILLYKSNNQAAGHVIIYLGNNKILNDGHIANADFPEKSWHEHYLGWIDPNDVGWHSTATNNIKAAVRL